MIQCKNLKLSFSGKTIFNDFNLTINKEENICISGASGKGKSTLLNLFQGYIIPDEGKVLIDNLEITKHNIRKIRDKIISVPQNINLSVKNGSELVDLMNITKSRIIIQNYMTSLGLEKELLSKDFGKISGGQKQRLIIAICLSLDKKIVLMDEPTSSLDDKSILLLIETIANLKDKTIISASHNQLWANSAGKIIEL